MSAGCDEGSAQSAERGGSNMSSVEASALIKRAAEPAPIGDKVKAAIARACRAVSRELMAAGFQPMAYGRARRIWKCEARRIDAEEMDALRRAAKDKALIGDARAEYKALLDRIAACEAALRLQDADFHGPSLDALGEAVRGVRRAVDKGGVKKL